MKRALLMLYTLLILPAWVAALIDHRSSALPFKFVSPLHYARRAWGANGHTSGGSHYLGLAVRYRLGAVLFVLNRVVRS